MNSRERVREEVERFYDELPFNMASVPAAAERLRGFDQLRAYPDLLAVIERDPPQAVVDIGCGTGWLPLTLAFHHGISATAVDLSATALARARAVAEALDVAGLIEFTRADLFDFAASRETRFDFVSSIGVLHHTGAALEGLRAVAGLTAPGGHLLVGLYHRHGRAPFLALFEQGEDYEEAYARYRLLHADLPEDLSRSWFRDQVLHPNETQHTLAEVDAVLEPLGMDLLSTSLTRFAPVRDKAAVFAAEPRQRELSARRNVEESTYFPGFFTALYRRGDEG